MSFLETREERRIREEREQKIKQEEQRLEREKNEREKEERKKSREDEFMGELELKLKKKIITLILSDYEGNDWKELAMNYFLEKGYVCVQNDISCTRSGAHYALTFVKKDHVDFFRTTKKIL